MPSSLLVQGHWFLEPTFTRSAVVIWITKVQLLVRLQRRQFVPSGGSAYTVELKEMSYWTTGEITRKLSFCLCMWGGVKVQCH